MRLHLTVVGAVLAALLVPSSASLHEPAQPPQPGPPPTFRSEANYVRVDVFATKDGVPVTDLTADDFELFEDNAAQSIEQFEHVTVSSTTTREERRDPTSPAQGREQAAEPRRRVYVIFLDTWHSNFEASVRARRPLVTMLEQLIGPDDLFAFVTPDMDPRHLTFARRTEVIEDMLMRNTSWGQRDSVVRLHPDEQDLETCFDEIAPPRGCRSNEAMYAYKGLAAQLIRRRREDEVLTTLEKLVRHLGAVREERKALILVTSGYQMFEPKPALLRREECAEPPTLGRAGTGPDGRITMTPGAAQGAGRLSSAGCEALAMKLANLDNHRRFRMLVQDANRYNVSFYPFDTRGLAVWDRGLTATRDETLKIETGEWYNRTTGARPGTVDDDRETLRVRLDSLRMLAEGTDGIAVINTNDLDAGARRIVQDLSSYYLLGYYSTNGSLDGRWRTIRVRAKRPGVVVRARKGYRALRPEDAEAATTSMAADPATTAAASALSSALGALESTRDGQPWRSRAAWMLRTDTASSTRGGMLWVTADLDPATLREASFAQGGTLTVVVTTGAGDAVTQVEVPVDAGARSATAEIALKGIQASAGDLVARLRFTPTAGGLPLTDTARITPGEAALTTAPRLWRASPPTRQRFQPTADPRYRRAEKVRVEVPVESTASSVTAVLLDRNGQTMAAIPVAAALMPADATGVGWARADVPLAPLAAGDYAIRVDVAHGDATASTITGFRVVP